MTRPPALALPRELIVDLFARGGLSTAIEQALDRAPAQRKVPVDGGAS